MASTRRLFIGLAPPIELALSVHAALVGAFVPDDVSRLRFTTAHDLHVTLLFLGAVLEEAIPELTAGLEQGLQSRGPLDLVLAGTGAFPTAARPRILWAGVKGARHPNDDLAELREAVVRSVREAGVGFAARETDSPFRPHMTLARMHSASRRKDPALTVTTMQPFFDLALRGAWRADEVILYQSVGTAGETVQGTRPGTAARYVKLQRFPMDPDGQRGP